MRTAHALPLLASGLLCAAPLPVRALSAPKPAAAPSQASSRASSQASSQAPGQTPAAGTFFALRATQNDGTVQPLSAYQGQVLLVVNVASECYYTRQYPALEQLYRDYQARGFTVLAFPSNDFGGQEPGSDSQIKAFCTGEQHVTFPLFQKIKVLGAGASPVFTYLTQQAGPPKWNFHKYLIARDGHVLSSYPSATAPDDKKLRAAIESALLAPAPAAAAH